MKKLNEFTIIEAAEGLRKGEFTSMELTNACLDKIKAKNDEINAFITVTEELALKQAEESDQRRREGETLSVLDGIPCAIKDNMNIKGVKTTAGSKMLENFEAVDDAFVIKKLREAGAVFLGKTNMDEFAMGGSTETSYFEATKNPLDTSRVPGGSSGGSAAAVAANMCIYALGSDTGGSIRQPASYCGIVGFKPTYGAISRNGLLSMASSLDQIGPMTKTVEDAEIVFEAIIGKDNSDSTSVEIIKNNKKIEKIAYFDGKIKGENDDFIERVAKKLVAEKIPEIKELEYALSVYYVLMPVEVSANLGRYDGIKYTFRAENAGNLEETYKKSRGEGFGSEAKRRIMLGAYASSEGLRDQYYGKAQKVRALIIKKLDEIFEKYDAIIVPTAPSSAFKFGAHEKDPVAMYLEDLYTVPANIAGTPAISVSVGKDRDGMPLGIQVMGQRGSDAIVLKIAKQIQLTS